MNRSRTDECCHAFAERRARALGGRRVDAFVVAPSNDTHLLLDHAALCIAKARADLSQPESGVSGRPDVTVLVPKASAAAVVLEVPSTGK